MTVILGGATFYCSMAAVVGGSAFAHMWWARKCYSWRAEVSDPACQIYESLTPNDVTPFFRKVAPAPAPELMAVNVEENPGVRVTEEQLTDSEHEMLMQEVRKWVRQYGQGTHPEKKLGMAKELREAGVDPEFLETNMFVSDRYEDPRPPKAPWGCGDSLQRDRLPVIIRALSQKVAATYPYIGDLRHVMVEYSPDGKFYRRPRTAHPFDGHDFVVIPLLRRPEFVATLSPMLRSSVSNGAEIVKQSWTSRDIDVLCPTRSFVRVYGQARYRWGFGIRPVQWFGHPTSSIEDYSFQKMDLNTGSTLWSKLAFWAPKPKERSSLSVEEKDEALIYLHFEGPVAANEVRRRWTKPEHMAFGIAPKAGSYDQWDDEVPSEVMVQQEGTLLWLMRNIVTMVRVT